MQYVHHMVFPPPNSQSRIFLIAPKIVLTTVCNCLIITHCSFDARKAATKTIFGTIRKHHESGLDSYFVKVSIVEESKFILSDKMIKTR